MMLAAIMRRLAGGEALSPIEVMEVEVGDAMTLFAVDPPAVPRPAPSVAVELMLDEPGSEVGTVAVKVAVKVTWAGQLLLRP